MISFPQLERALVLQQQGRHEMAEEELRRYLAENPRDGFGHALLAVSLIEQDRRDDAEQAAREAIANEPDQAFSHYVHARVLAERVRSRQLASGAMNAGCRCGHSAFGTAFWARGRSR